MDFDIITIETFLSRLRGGERNRLLYPSDFNFLSRLRGGERLNDSQNMQ